MKSYGTIRHTPRHYTAHGQEIRPKWVIDTNNYVTERLKRIFIQVKHTHTGTLELTDTLESSKDVLWILDRWPMDISDNDRLLLVRRATEYDRELELVENVMAGGAVSFQEGGAVPVLEPRDYQVQGSNMILALKRLLLLDELGLGKTFTLLLTARDAEALPMLLVCQPHLRRQMLRECQKFFPMTPAYIINKGKPYNIRDTREMRGHSPHIYIISYNMLDGWAGHFAGIIRAVLFDEVQELRRPESIKYLAAKRVADAAEYVVGATATLVYNYGGEVHNIVEVVKPDALGTRSEFIRAWGHEGTNDKIIVDDPRALGTWLRDNGIVIRRTRKEVGRELPEALKIEHVVDVDEKIYDEEVEKQGGLILAEKILAGTGSFVERRNMRGDLDWKLRLATGLAKAPYVAAFVDLLLESEDKVLVGLWHRDVYDVLMEYLKHHNPVMYSGSESPAKKDKNARAFMQPYDPYDEVLSQVPRVMLLSLRSGAGLDGLQDACKVVVFGELDWAPATHDQFIGRLRRDGADIEDPVVAYYLNAMIGSDPVVLETLGLKRGQSNPIHDPNIEMFGKMAENLEDRVKLLARAALARRKNKRVAA